MTPITPQQFLIRQPAFPETKSSDKFYLDLCNKLLELIDTEGLFKTLNDSVKQRVAICVTGYYQDIISDAGLWRGFISACRRLYGNPVPFYELPEDYVEAELNEIDVRFLIWYFIAMLDTDRRDICPEHHEIIRLGEIWYRHLNETYDEAPVPEEYNIAFQLEMFEPDDEKEIVRFSNWLFLHSYLITPAFALDLAQIVSRAELDKEGGENRLHDLLDNAMNELPTGPLALFLREWIFLILHDKLPDRVSGPEKKEVETHKYYTAVTKATGGKPIAYFPDYSQLNEFFIKVLGWEEGQDHLPQMRNYADFVIQADREKGMLLARNVAKCIADPDNPLYNRAYARNHSFDLLTVRGLCPPDLLKTILDNHWLPDAHFPDSDNTALVAGNADFIARCYLQLFYRGD